MICTYQIYYIRNEEKKQMNTKYDLLLNEFVSIYFYRRFVNFVLL